MQSSLVCFSIWMLCSTIPFRSDGNPLELLMVLLKVMSNVEMYVHLAWLVLTCCNIYPWLANCWMSYFGASFLLLLLARLLFPPTADIILNPFGLKRAWLKWSQFQAIQYLPKHCPLLVFLSSPVVTWTFSLAHVRNICRHTQVKPRAKHYNKNVHIVWTDCGQIYFYILYTVGLTVARHKPTLMLPVSKTREANCYKKRQNSHRKWYIKLHSNSRTI